MFGTGGGRPSPEFTPAEELALAMNKGRPVLEGIQGGQPLTLSHPYKLSPSHMLTKDDSDPVEGTSAAGDEETVCGLKKAGGKQEAVLTRNHCHNVFFLPIYGKVLFKVWLRGPTRRDHQLVQRVTFPAESLDVETVTEMGVW
ncbi:hypothetical protein AMECASPLE_030699 [Ameca splendens]|uniref:Uncharacterized protein n=1 Tax=Ameca splendens TaxID=208324 RepID=A0ABV0YTW0_9TELE